MYLRTMAHPKGFEPPWRLPNNKEPEVRLRNLARMAHPRGFEPLASAFGGQRSIQLS